MTDLLWNRARFKILTMLITYSACSLAHLKNALELSDGVLEEHINMLKNAGLLTEMTGKGGKTFQITRRGIEEMQSFKKASSWVPTKETVQSKI